MTKLELGSGERPSTGYLHQDITAIKGVKLDFIGNEWHKLQDNSLEEVIAVGVFEHFTFKEARENTKRIYEILKPGGIFLFDVPDLDVWAEYLFNLLKFRRIKNISDSELKYYNSIIPFEQEKIYAMFCGWQRFEGDEHQSIWNGQDISELLFDCGFIKYDIDKALICKDSHGKEIHKYEFDILKEFHKRDIYRNRFRNPKDAHLYVRAEK